MSIIMLDSELSEELNHSNNLTNKIFNERNDDNGIIITPEVQGRKYGDLEVDSKIRENIAIDVSSGNLSIKEAAKIYDVSKDSVLNYSNGQVGDRIDESLKDKVLECKTQIKDKALNTLMDTLGLLDTKIGNVSKAKDLSQIAKDLSSVANKMENKDTKLVNKGNIIFYSPRQKKEEDYGKVIPAIS